MRDRNAIGMILLQGTMTVVAAAAAATAAPPELGATARDAHPRTGVGYSAYPVALAVIVALVLLIVLCAGEKKAKAAADDTLVSTRLSL